MYPSIVNKVEIIEKAQAGSVKLVHEKAKSDGKAQMLIVRPDARVANVKTKFDRLSDQLADLTLLIRHSRKSQPGSSLKHAINSGDGTSQVWKC